MSIFSSEPTVPIQTILVIENRLYRISLARLLAENGFEILRSDRDPSELDTDGLVADGIDSPLVVISTTSYDVNTSDKIRYFDNAFKGSRILVLSDAFSKAHMRECLSAGADGYLLPDCDEQVFFESLRLVYRGQSVFPADLVFGKTQGKNIREGAALEADLENALENLDKVEMTLLRMLVSGMINKEMQRELSMKDDRLKFYLYRLLKKIGVTNRVQAAVWAVHNGIPAYEANAFAVDRGRSGNAETKKVASG